MNGNSDSLANEEHERAGESAGETQLANRLLRALIDTMPIGVIVSNADGALLMTNPAGMSILGGAVAGNVYHPERRYTAHRPDGSIFPPEEMPLRRALERGQITQDVEILIHRKDGAERLVLAGAAPVRDEAGRVVSAVMVFQDITERKQAEETLEQRVRERTAELARTNADLQLEIHERKRAEEAVKAERKRLHDVLEMLPAYVVLLSPDHHVPFENRFFRERFGESHGRRCFEYLFGRSEPCETCETYTVLQTNAPHRWEWIGPDGRNYDIYDFPFTDSDGSPLIMEMGIDITERKRAEEALKETSEALEWRVQERTAELAQAVEQLEMAGEELQVALEKYRVLFESFPLGITISDKAGKVVESNEEAERLLGVSETEHDQRRIDGPEWQIIRPDGSPMPAEEYASVRALQENRLVDNVEMGIVKEGGKVNWINVTAAPIPLEDYGVAIAYGDITERRRAEQALRETHDYLDNLLTYANAPIIVWDPDFRITRFNAAFERLTGRKADDVCGKSLDLLFPQDRKEEALEHIRRAVAGERWEVVDIPIQHVDRSVRTVLWNSATLYAADGTTVVATIAQGQDITTLKQAQQALQSYADRLQVLHEADQAILGAHLSVEKVAEAAIRRAPQLLNCVRAGVMLFDREVGEASLLAVHTKGETRLEKGWRGPIYAEWAGMLDALSRGETYVVENVQEGTASSFVIEALRSEGVRAYVHVPLVVQGQLMGSLTLGMDTPGPLGAEQKEIALELAIAIAVGIQQARLYEQVRRHAENMEDLVAERTAALQASEARFRTIFEEAAIGIALVDLTGRYVESNSAFQKMLSYSGEELRNLAFPEVTYSEDAATDKALFEDLVAGKRGSCRSEKRYICRDGQVRWASRVLSLVRDAEGQPQYAISMTEDITEQRQALDALMRTEKLAVAGRLAASLAHEINNPLQSVIGCLALADEALAEGGDAERYLEVAREELKRVARVVAQLRDLHRPPTPEEWAPVDVNTLLERVLTLSKKKCEESKVKVIRKAAKDLPPLQLASDRIEQVFLNLVLNAIDAMPGGGRLRVSTSRTSQPVGVRITFADSGMGIFAKDLPHIFEPFYSTKSEGLGLGLFVSYDAVKQHGGRMDVESQEGKGSTFTVWLPVQTR